MTRRTRTDSPQHRRACTLSAMQARGTITADQADAGRYFAGQFDAAQASTGVMGYGRSEPGGGTIAGRARADGQATAGRRFMETMRALGGHEAPTGRAAYHVLGRGETMREFAGTTGTDKNEVGAYLAAALALLVGYYWPEKLVLTPPLEKPPCSPDLSGVLLSR